MNLIREKALSIWNAAVDAVRAKSLVVGSIRVEGDLLHIRDTTWDLGQFDRIVVVGGGKAGTAMAEGLVESLDDRLPIKGWVNVPEGTESTLDGITLHPARPAGINEPTEAGVVGTREILKLVQEANSTDLCIALLSGGGSALMPAPADGVTLADKQAVTRFLSGAGANIAELNTVRKHLSLIKGGGLAAASRAGELVTLVLSDVLGDPLDLIASGPTVSDTSSLKDALDVLSRYDRENVLGDRIREVLQKAIVKNVPANAHTIVIGNNQVAVDAAINQAHRFDAVCESESATECEGDAAEVGTVIAQRVVDMLRHSDPDKSHCLVSGGEPTVKLAAEEVRGKGGRNQQLVLAAYMTLVANELSNEEWNRVTIISGGTDGEDGPTDAAGGTIDAAVHAAIMNQNLNVDDAIRRNDAYTLLEKAGGLIITGPTGTNVCDIRVAFVDKRGT